MQKGFIVAFLALALTVGTTILSWASDIAPDKLKAYAEIYPEVFKATASTGANKSATNRSMAVALLLESFNGTTNVDELSTALRSNDPSPMKPDSQIKQLVSDKGLAWEEYQSITHLLARDPKQFRVFLMQLDMNRVHRELISRADGDPTFVRQIRSADHQIIVKNLLDSQAKK